jgi:hypothetical protein
VASTVVRVYIYSISVRMLKEEWKEKTVQSVRFVASRTPNGRIHARTRASAVTDRLRHGRATVVKLCDMGNRQSSPQ